MSAIRKLVIPVAGLGTRLLPATKAQPKEMLPLVDKPIIQYIVEEAVRSGITDIILVTGKNKRAIEDHFDRDHDLERWLESGGKHAHAERIRRIAQMANFIYVRQKGPYGNGTPVLNAKPVIGNEPFAVVWGDDIWDCPRVPQVKQLIEVYEKYTDPVVTLARTDDAGTHKYGIIAGEEVEPGVYQIGSITEKPGPKRAKSRIASLGGFIFTPDIFDALERTPKGRDGELWLVDAVSRLRQTRPLYGKVIDGTYHDPGSKLGWLKANVEFGLQDEEVGKKFASYLRHRVNHNAKRKGQRSKR